MPKQRARARARSPEPRPCTCYDPSCMAKQPAEVQRSVRAYITAFQRSKTKLIKKQIPPQLLAFCCINCRFAGSHICQRECFAGVYGGQ